MSRKEVNRYRSGTKNPQQEVHVWRSKDKTKVYIIDYKEGRVVLLEKE